MAPDDEVLFGHVRDETRSSYERAEDGSALALAEFELHGATLRSLARWYPEETRVRTALAEWELLGMTLASRGVHVEALH